MSERSLQAVAGFVLFTADLARLVQFYRDVLGFTVHGADAPIGTDEMALLGLAGAGRPRMLSLSDQSLRIDQLEQAGPTYPPGSDAASIWFQHLAVVVDDMPGAYGRLRDITPISQEGPQQLLSASDGVQAFKFRDPDGHPLELLGYRTPKGRAESALWPNDVGATRIIWRGQQARLIGDPDGHLQ